MERNRPEGDTTGDGTVLQPEDLAALIAIPESTLAQWRYLCKGPAYVKMGKHVRYRRVDVDAWLAANRHSAA